MRKLVCTALATAGLLAGLAFAHPPPDSTAELERMGVFIGSWEVKGTTLAPGAGTPGTLDLAGTMTCEWVLEGKWMLMRQSDRMGDRQSHHLAMATWDGSKGLYIRRVFTDTSSIHPMEEGRWIDEKTFEFAGEFGWDDGNTYGFRNIYTIVSNNEMKYEMFQNVNGGEYFRRSEAMLTKRG